MIRLKNEAMSYWHGLSVLFASPLVTATNRFFDGVNTGNSAFQHLAKSAAFAVFSLKNDAYTNCTTRTSRRVD